MDTRQSCRQNLPTIVQVLCKEGELSNENESCRLACKNLQADLGKLQAGLKKHYRRKILKPKDTRHLCRQN